MFGMAMVAIVLASWFSQPRCDSSGGCGAIEESRRENKPVEDSDFWSTFTPPGDLYAQWVMAISAVAATVLSGWAVFLLRATLVSTREALVHAENTARAAWASVTTAEGLAIAQAQAYVYANKAAIYWRDDETPAFCVYFTNKGATPVKMAWFGGELEIVEKGKRPKTKSPKLRVVKPISGIGTGDDGVPRTIHDLKLVDREADIIKKVNLVRSRARPVALHLRGTIHYTTIFDREYVSDIHFYVVNIDTPQKGKFQAMAPVGGGTAFSLIKGRDSKE